MFAYSLSSSYVAQILFLPLPSAEHTLVADYLGQSAYLASAQLKWGLGRKKGKALKGGSFWEFCNICSPRKRTLASKPTQGVDATLFQTARFLCDEKHGRKLTPALLKEALLILSLLTHMHLPTHTLARCKFDTGTGKRSISSSEHGLPFPG